MESNIKSSNSGNYYSIKNRLFYNFAMKSSKRTSNLTNSNFNKIVGINIANNSGNNCITYFKIFHF